MCVCFLPLNFLQVSFKTTLNTCKHADTHTRTYIHSHEYIGAHRQSNPIRIVLKRATQEWTLILSLCFVGTVTHTLSQSPSYPHIHIYMIDSSTLYYVWLTFKKYARSFGTRRDESGWELRMLWNIFTTRERRRRKKQQRWIYIVTFSIELSSHNL